MKQPYRRIGLLALITIIALLGCFLIRTQANRIAIHFDDTERIPAYQFESQAVPLKIAMISILDRANTEQDQRQLANGIGRLLNRPVLLLRRKSYMEINRLLMRGEADIALLSTGAYCTYGREEGFQLLAMQERNHLPYYYGYIITPQDGTAESLSDLRGTRFAYVDPLSYSGCLGVQEQLAAIGEESSSFFQSSYFTYSHAASIRAVANHEADGAAIDSLAYDYLQHHAPQQLQKIRIISILPPRGTSPVVARRDLEGAAAIQQAFLHLHDDPEARAAMQNLMIDRFILPDSSLYPPIQWREGGIR